MIFVNRKRIIQNSGAKDPTKYWYIEKYVYGVLKETVEVPLGTSTTFSAVASGYDDDTFYGWSINSTSTTSTFNTTTSYSNTSVKNNLDENNTLKIYAIYSYHASYGSLQNGGTYNSSYNSDLVGNFYVHKDGTYSFNGNSIQSGTNSSGSSFTNYSGITVNISGNTISRFITNSNGSTPTTLTIKSGSYIRFSLSGTVHSDSSGGYGTTSKLTISGSSLSYSTYSTSYRVTSHS